MAGFVRRYTDYPGIDVITQIEGIVILDLAPPGTLQASGVGTAAIIGEFADMTYGVSVSTSGAVTSNPRPVEVYSPADMLQKVGGFDSTIGDNGISGGSGFLAVRNKKFSRLILVPVNLCSAYAVRVWRELPTNKGPLNPIPIVPFAGASVAAGREFKSSGNRIRLGASVSFTGRGAYLQSVTGEVLSNYVASPTQVLVDPLATFVTSGVKQGDILVLGVIGATGAQGANAGTYRVYADATLEDQIILERLDGVDFNWSTGTDLAYRIHPSTDADSGIGELAVGGACTIPARPLDATIPAATVCLPTIIPPAGTALTWDPLSGLSMRTHPTGALTYTAAVQAANAVCSASIEALYDVAFDSLFSADLPSRDVNIVVPARTSQVIRAKQLSHVMLASQQGVGRITIISPEINQTSVSTVLGDSDPGVGANRSERVFYSWPGALTYVPESVNYSMKTALGTTTLDGKLDTQANAWLASVLSILPPERNPGEASATTKSVLSSVLGIQRGVTGLGINEYTQFRQRGAAALRNDKNDGIIFQSGITTSLIPGQKNIARRRMADYIEDNTASILNPFSKQPLSDSNKDAMLGEIDSWLDNLQSINNKAAQRIVSYLLDDKSGNTPESEAAGVHVIIIKVRTLASADFIVTQCEIGEGVVTTTAA
jgi:hypothetical protein